MGLKLGPKHNRFMRRSNYKVTEKKLKEIMDKPFPKIIGATVKSRPNPLLKFSTKDLETLSKFLSSKNR